MSKLPTRRTLLSLALAGLAGALPAHAEDAYPTKPITLISASGPGSGADLLSRVVAERLGAALKQQVLVENKPGASGGLAGQTVVRAKNDGYTLLFTSASGTVMNQAIQSKPPFDTTRDLTPVAQIGAGGVVLVVANDFPAKDLKEFIALVKANPNKHQYATWGIGSGGHLVMEAIEMQTGMKIDHIPYKTIGQIIQDLQGGVLKIAYLDAGSAVALVKSGRIRPLAISGTARAPGLPTLPTMTEQGVKFEADGWYGIFAPKDTPAPIVTKLNAEINKVLVDPALKERFLQLNLADPPIKSAEQFAKTVRDDLAVWSTIVKTNHIKPE